MNIFPSHLICGIDEAGRGPLAGPIVAAGVVVPNTYELLAVDSKKISAKKREKWMQDFIVFAQDHDDVDYAIAKIDVPEINEKGIAWANKEVFRRLILELEADEYIVDGNLKLGDFGEKTARTECRVRADQSVRCVAAASILAKTFRDQIMRDLHDEFPIYHWDKNKGYGTWEHIHAIQHHGSSRYHRGKYMQTVIEKEYDEKWTSRHKLEDDAE